MKKNNSYLIEVTEAKGFLYGQLELYKIEFAETDNNKYLQVMNKMNQTLETVIKMDETIRRLSKEIHSLKQK